MATRTCPYCKEQVKREAIVCKHCGRNLPVYTSQQIQADQNATTVGCTVAILVVFVLGFIVYGIGQLTKSPPPPPPPPVAVTCQGVVEPDCHGAYEAGRDYLSDLFRDLHTSAVVSPTIFHGYCTAGATSLYDVSYRDSAGDVLVVMSIVRTDSGVLAYCGL